MFGSMKLEIIDNLFQHWSMKSHFFLVHMFGSIKLEITDGLYTISPHNSRFSLVHMFRSMNLGVTDILYQRLSMQYTIFLDPHVWKYAVNH